MFKLLLTACLLVALAGCGRNAWQSDVQTLEARDRRASSRTPLGRASAFARQTTVFSGAIISADRASRVRFDR